MKKAAFLTFKSLLHLALAGVILFSFYPIAKWYFDSKILWGVDFYYTASIVNLIKQNFTLPQAGWGYAWFTGWPLLSNYPLLHYYLILPLTNFFFLLTAIKIWMLVTLFFFFLGCYGCFFILSRNFAFSLILTICTIYSVGVYGSLMWGGSLPSHATQAFLPWVVFFIIQYLQKGAFKSLLLASLLTGFAILGHPQIVIAYIYPYTGILILFWVGTLKLFGKIRALILYTGISFLIALPLLYSSMGGALKVLIVTHSLEVASSTARVDSELSRSIDAFHKAQPLRIYQDTNTTTFVLLVAAFIFMILALIIFRRFKLFLRTLPFFILSIFSIIYVVMFSYGISIYHGGWYRLFWTSPFWIGLLAASFWHVGQQSLHEKLNLSKYIHVAIPLLNLIALLIGIVFLQQYSKGLKERIIPRSNPSSAFPDVLNTRQDEKKFEALKMELVPKWLDTTETNYRLFSADQTVNIWWNSLYKMPLGRGYFDPPLPPENKGYFFWLDASLSRFNGTEVDQLTGNFNYPPHIAFNNTLFLIDWYGIKYYEAGHAGPTAYAPLPKGLTTPQFIQNQAELDFDKERYNKGHQTLNYYELKSDYVSPILLATNAKTLGIVASDSGYETIIRDIADMNISSQKLIPIKLGQNLDQISPTDLKNIDGLILYDYKYGNKDSTFKKIAKYLEGGKKVFIDTGVEVAESDSSSPLPEIFPISSTFRKPLQDIWQFEIINKDLGKSVDFSKFDPPLFNKSPWKLSFPRQESDLRNDSQAILKNQGKVLMASKKIGNGELVWSGLNLPYHVARFHNETEIQFFKNILATLVDFNSQTQTPTYKSGFMSATNRNISVTNARAVLFKEQFYPGWTAKNDQGGLKIYKAGPAFPGFMYVPLPKDSGKQTTVTFSYSGALTAWVLSILSYIIIIYILDRIFLKGAVFGRITKIAYLKVNAQLNKWWSREED
ncbi:hypothetical protein HY025_05140 [Candidatus Daviesbacteria bacterium]|nr:hypothetical protein [Candidatus Daviesbacteria bacterium]